MFSSHHAYKHIDCRLLRWQAAATFLIIFRVASGKAWAESTQEVISTVHSSSFSAGSHTRVGRVGLESVEVDASFIQVGKGNRINDWELRDRDIQVRVDRERFSTKE
jgi:hypothetical protein